MSNKENVLVFSGATYPAIQVIDCLKHTMRYHVIAGASYPNHSEFVCTDTVINLPFINDERFIVTFCRLIKDRCIKYVIPTDETIALVLMEHEQEIPAIIVCSPYETTKLCRYKSLAYKKLAGEPYTPNTYDIASISSISEFPIFIKPDSSQGSRGARLVNSIGELETVADLENYVLCEYLPGEEYTVDCFTNRDRKVLFCNPRVRTRLMNGITARGHNIPYTEEFQEVIEGLNSKIVFRGYWYVQLKRDKEGTLKLLEVCTRFAGSFAISKGRGINLPLLALTDFGGRPTEAIANDYVVECDKTYIDRYRLSIDYDTVYIDYDDTITDENGKSVNPYVLAFLYQCKKKGRRIILLTRHQETFHESLSESMQRLALAEPLFDKIVELKWEDSKVNAIETKNSIFIDNSYAERKQVYDKWGIPVFDVCNIDCLFDWRD